MAACCGKSKTQDKMDEVCDSELNASSQLEPNALSLARVHNILDRYANADVAQETVSGPDGQESVNKLFEQSSQIKSCVRVAASLWNRAMTDWSGNTLDRSGGQSSPAGKPQGDTDKRTKKKATQQGDVYLSLQGCIPPWIYQSEIGISCVFFWI
jgi:hypothetical protein